MRDDRKKDLNTADVASASHERGRDREFDREAVGGPRPVDHDPTRTPARTEEEARRAEFDRPHRPAGQHERSERSEDTDLPPLFETNDRDDLHGQWGHIQTRFVDDPRHSVEEADHLVAATVQRLAESFARQREQLENQWSRTGDVSTEDLRIAMRRYRAFFERMLTL